MKPDETDFTNYGAYKDINNKNDRLKKFIRKLGVKNRFVKFIDFKFKDKLLIEIGCGDGDFLNELKNNGFTNLIGIEISPSYEKKFCDLNIIICDAESFLRSIEVNSVGVILALDVFEHINIKSLNNLLQVAHNVLSEDGKIIFRVPNMGSPLGMINYFGDTTHVTPLNLSSVMHLAWSNNFVLSSIESEPFSYPRSLFDLLGRIFYGLSAFNYKLMMKAFGVNKTIYSPNIICTFSKKSI
jgi:SAM-dependent methyltransferase